MRSDLRRQIRKLFVTPLENRMHSMIRRAVVTAVTSKDRHQRVQVRFLGQLRDALQMQPYGFAHKPHPGAEALLAALGGNPNKLFAFVVGDTRYQVALVDGEVAVFDDLGSLVHFKRDGLHVKSSSGTTTIDDNLHVAGKITSVGNMESAAKVTATGNVESGAKVTATGNVESGADVQDSVGTLAQHRTWAGTHTHVGSPTAPLGVQSNTGQPVTPP